MASSRPGHTPRARIVGVSFAREVGGTRRRRVVRSGGDAQSPSRADRVRGDLRTVRLRAHQGGPRALLRRDRRVGATLRIAFVPNLRVALDDMDAPYLRPVSSAGSGLSA